jgi:hypothetical protein
MPSPKSIIAVQAGRRARPSGVASASDVGTRTLAERVFMGGTALPARVAVRRACKVRTEEA